MDNLTVLRTKRDKLREEATKFLVSHRNEYGLLSNQDQKQYDQMIREIVAFGYAINVLQSKAHVSKEFIKDKREEKPALGVKPYYVAAWKRIGELVEAIERQYESSKGDAKLVEKWAREIQWQCYIIDAIKDGEDDNG